MSKIFYQTITKIVQSRDADTLKENIELVNELLANPGQSLIAVDDVRDFCKSLAEKSSRFPEVETKLILPVLRSFMKENDDDNMRIVQETLFDLICEGFFSVDFIQNDLCPFILQLYRVYSKDEYRLNVIRGLATLCPCLRNDYLLNKHWPAFVDICNESSEDLKARCIGYFVKFAASAGAVETDKHILPVFETMSRHSLQEIRKACVDASVMLSFLSSSKGRTQILTPLFISFLNDEARIVMESALISMGHFISTFADSDKTFMYYLSNGGDICHLKMLESYHSTVYDRTMRRRYEIDYQALESNSISNSSKNESQLHLMFPNLMLEDDSQTNISSSDQTNNNETQEEAQSEPQVNLNQVESQSSSPSADSSSEPESKEDLSFSFDEPKKEDDEKSSEEENQKSDQTLNQEFSETAPSTDCEVKAEFDTFLYWREPLPSIDSEINLQSTHDMQSNCNYNLIRSQDGHTFFQTSSGQVVYQLQNNNCSSQSSNESKPQNCSTVANMHNQEKLLRSFLTFCFGSPEMQNEQTYMPQYPELYQKVQEQLGHFEQDIVPHELLEHFVSMSHSNGMNDMYSTDFTYHCAYSLPAVAFTLGPDNWPCLRGTFCNLLRKMSLNIRFILASSLYPIALIIGRENTSRDLFSAFSLFMNDFDDVRTRLLPNFVPFVKLLNEHEQEIVLSQLQSFLKLENYFNWRFRVTFCQLLTELIPLYKKPSHYKDYIVKLMVILLKDKVAEVRRAAIMVTVAVLKQLHSISSEDLYPKPAHILKLLCNFGESLNWYFRQTFVNVCEAVFMRQCIPVEELAEHLLDMLCNLAKDRVPNVRLVVARTLERFGVNESLLRLFTLDKVKEAYTLLLKDSDKDVRDEIDRFGSIAMLENEFGFAFDVQPMEIDNSDPNECDNQKESKFTNTVVPMEMTKITKELPTTMMSVDHLIKPNEMDTSEDIDVILVQPTVLAEPMKALLVLDQQANEEQSENCSILHQLESNSISELSNQPTPID